MCVCVCVLVVGDREGEEGRKRGNYSASGFF